MVRFLILAGLIALSAGCQPQVQTAPAQQCECTNCPCENCENDATKCAPKEARGWPVPDPTEFTPFVDFHFHDDHASDRRFYVTKETSKKIMEHVRLKSLTPIDKYDASGKPYIEFEASEHIEPAPLPDPNSIDYTASGYTGGLEYVSDLKGIKVFGRHLPKIIVSGRKLIYSRHDDGYVDEITGIPMAWFDFGDGPELPDEIDIRADENSTKIKTGDILFRPKTGELRIVTKHGEDDKSDKPVKFLHIDRALAVGDKIHPQAAKYLISEIFLTPSRDAGIARIGKTELWAKFEGKEDWVVADRRTFTYSAQDSFYGEQYPVSAVGEVANIRIAADEAAARQRRLDTAVSDGPHGE